MISSCTDAKDAVVNTSSKLDSSDIEKIGHFKAWGEKFRYVHKHSILYTWENSKMTLISLRLTHELREKLNWYAEKENIGKTIALRKILEIGMREIKIEYSLDLYSKGKITLMKAAEIAGLSLWEMLDIIRERRVQMYYTIRDAEKDIRASLKGLLG